MRKKLKFTPPDQLSESQDKLAAVSWSWMPFVPDLPRSLVSADESLTQLLQGLNNVATEHVKLISRQHCSAAIFKILT